MTREEADRQCADALDVLEREIPRMWMAIQPPGFWACVAIFARAFWRTIRGLPLEPPDPGPHVDIALLAAGSAILRAAGRDPMPSARHRPFRRRTSCP